MKEINQKTDQINKETGYINKKTEKIDKKIDKKEKLNKGVDDYSVKKAKNNIKNILNTTSLNKQKENNISKS